MIRLTNIAKSHDGGNTYAVKDFNLTINTGETVVLLGSSGSGKSTTLKMINRLVEPSAGSIWLGEVDILKIDVVKLRRQIGYVFQEIGLFPHLTVEQNVEIVPKLLGWDAKRRKERANELLEMVSLSSKKFSQRLPHELSGGQQQRVGVARALAAEPEYLLMDEPFGALDALTRDSLQLEIVRIKHQLKKTIVFVTHDIFEALTIADRIGVMHEGKLVQIGQARELIETPANQFIHDLFSKPAKQLAQYGEVL
jgi:osmoprotectant transport system ATP-binding protein